MKIIVSIWSKKTLYGYCILPLMKKKTLVLSLWKDLDIEISAWKVSWTYKKTDTIFKETWASSGNC